MEEQFNNWKLSLLGEIAETIQELVQQRNYEFQRAAEAKRERGKYWVQDQAQHYFEARKHQKQLEALTNYRDNVVKTLHMQDYLYVTERQLKRRGTELVWQEPQLRLSLIDPKEMVTSLLFAIN